MAEQIELVRQKVRASLTQTIKNLPAMQETQVRSLSWGDSPGEGKWLPTIVFLPVILPSPKEPDGLQSMGSQRVTQLSN